MAIQTLPSAGGALAFLGFITPDLVFSFSLASTIGFTVTFAVLAALIYFVHRRSPQAYLDVGPLVTAVVICIMLEVGIRNDVMPGWHTYVIASMIMALNVVCLVDAFKSLRRTFAMIAALGIRHSKRLIRALSVFHIALLVLGVTAMLSPALQSSSPATNTQYTVALDRYMQLLVVTKTVLLAALITKMCVGYTAARMEKYRIVAPSIRQYIN